MDDSLSARAAPPHRMPCSAADRLLTVALSTHRPETIPAAAVLMDRHDVICLEEPATPGFDAMLSGRLSIDDYLPQTGTEYPLFTARSCRVHRRMHGQGKTILQVEPYLETLLEIQLRLADGAAPSEIASRARFSSIYAAEKAATGALLDFYQTAAAGDVDATVMAVLRFAETDAHRFRLRDRMRAAGLKDILGTGRRVYVEAGVMHLSLIPWLAAARRPDQRIRVVHLQAGEARRLSGRPVLLAPGDCLTFRKIFAHRSAPETEWLLAAQSLIYNRIVETAEMTATAGGHPHLTDEQRCINMVSALDTVACRALVPHLRRLPAAAAREMVAAFVKRRGTPTADAAERSDSWKTVS